MWIEKDKCPIPAQALWSSRKQSKAKQKQTPKLNHKWKLFARALLLN